MKGSVLGVLVFVLFCCGSAWADGTVSVGSGMAVSPNGSVTHFDAFGRPIASEPEPRIAPPGLGLPVIRTEPPSGGIVTGEQVVEETGPGKSEAPATSTRKRWARTEIEHLDVERDIEPSALQDARQRCAKMCTGHTGKMLLAYEEKGIFEVQARDGRPYGVECNCDVINADGLVSNEE